MLGFKINSSSVNNNTWMLGSRFPADISHITPDSMELQFLSSESAVAIFRFIKPTPDELFDFEHAQIDFGVKRFGKIGLFVEVIGNGFGEFDSDFHYDTVIKPKDFNMMHATEGTGLTVYNVLVDEKNILRAMRTIGLSTEITNLMSDIFKYQQTVDGRFINNEERKKHIMAAWEKYPTSKELFDACDKKFSVAIRNNVA